MSELDSWCVWDGKVRTVSRFKFMNTSVPLELVFYSHAIWKQVLCWRSCEEVKPSLFWRFPSLFSMSYLFLLFSKPLVSDELLRILLRLWLLAATCTTYPSPYSIKKFVPFPLRVFITSSEISPLLIRMHSIWLILPQRYSWSAWQLSI